MQLILIPGPLLYKHWCNSASALSGLIDTTCCYVMNNWASLVCQILFPHLVYCWLEPNIAQLSSAVAWLFFSDRVPLKNSPIDRPIWWDMGCFSYAFKVWIILCILAIHNGCKTSLFPQKVSNVFIHKMWGYSNIFTYLFFSITPAFFVSSTPSWPCMWPIWGLP